MDLSFEDKLSDFVYLKNGVEIGGPSDAPSIYANANIIDNVVFLNDLIWHSQFANYNYYSNKFGKVIINDATNIKDIKDNTYDFCLEHIANPLKAVKEWLRITKKDGFNIIIVVPEKSCCFDHKREYSKFETILSQFNKDVGEDDLSTLPEILKNHDLSLDPPAGTFEQFTKRSLDNYNNRCLHHYVYDDDLLMKICEYFNCTFIDKNLIGFNRWFIMKKQLLFFFSFNVIDNYKCQQLLFLFLEEI